jgi:flagellar basal body L-ring protein FlgH
MRRFLAACLLLLLAGCGNKAKDLYDTAQLEEKQNNRPHATKLYRQIAEEYPDSRESGEDSFGRAGESALEIHKGGFFIRKALLSLTLCFSARLSNAEESETSRSKT